MATKLLFSLCLASIACHRGCLAHPFELINQKPDTPLFVNLKYEGGDWKGWQKVENNKISTSFREMLEIIIAPTQFDVTEDSIQQNVLADKAHFARFIVDPDNPDKAFGIGASFTKEGLKAKALETIKGKKHKKRMTTKGLAARLSAGKQLFSEEPEK